MSAPSRGRGGGATRGTSATTPSSRGSNRATFSNTSRGRGRGRGAATASTPGDTNGGAGILQKLRTGTLQRNGDVTHTNERSRGAPARGQTSTSRARSNATKSSNTRRKQSPEVSSQAPSPAPATSNHRDFAREMSEKYNLLKPRRDAERKKAIRDGFLSDPDQKTSLDKAITPVGTCTEMCPQFERVERIVQNMVDKAEKVTHVASDRDTPSEEKMVKRFRRSAAGYDEQLPSDIRTPETLKRTLDYLLDRVVDVERLASIHKFVWDRTRGIRNDFSIQQVSKLEDVKIAVNCYERIARFHILSMHQLSNPDNLQEGEHFEPQQEREQLNNTLLSLMYYYDDHRDNISFPNEAEFRAYCILFERQSLHPDLEERMQSWPQELLDNPRVQTAFKIYTAAGNSIFDQGPLRPFVPHSLAQSNSGKFWTLLASRQVSYMMACVAEITFNQVRFAALDALWRSGKSAPQGHQSRNQEWTMAELTNYLGFDDEEQTLEFVQEFGLGFGTRDSGEQYLDMTALSSNTLDKSSIPSAQIFSASIVEEKRFRRTLVSVINGVNIATAIRQGSVVELPLDDNEMDTQDMSEDEQSLFIPEQSTEQDPTISSGFGGGFNPEAPAFTPPGPATAQAVQKPLFGTTFGSSPNGQVPNSIFGTAFSTAASQATTPNIQATTPSNFGANSSSTIFGFKPQTGPPATQPSIPNVFKGFGATQEPVNPTDFASNPIYPTFHLGQAAQDTSSQPPNQAQTQVDTNSFGTDTTPHFSPSQFGQNIAVNPGVGQNLSKDKVVASPLSTFFGQKLIDQQAKEKEEKQKGAESAIPQPANVFTPVFAPASTRPAPSAPVQPEQSIAESPRKAPFFLGIPNDVAQAQEKSNVASPVTEPQDSSPQETPFFFTPQAPVSQPSLPAAVPKPTPVFSFDLSSKQLGSTNESSLFSKSQEGTATQTPPAVPAYKLTSFEEGKAQISKSPSPALDAAATSTSTKLREQTSSQPSSPAPQAIITPLQPVTAQVDNTELIRNTARLVLVQPQGLLEYFVGNHVSSLLVEVVKEFQKNQHDRVMTYVRSRFLSRKFLHLWKHITQQRVLSKRAKQRRKLLAVAMRAEQQKQRRNEEELEQIVAAAQETKQIQEYQKKIKIEVERKRAEEVQLKQDIAQAGQIAGQKRKILAERDNKRSDSGTRMTGGISHKRSRTDGAISEPSLSVRSSSSPTAASRRSTASSRFTQSFFGRSTSSQDLKQSRLSYKVDNTKTDYFKLKAMGIDPDTPIIPDTARSLAHRQQKQNEERQTSLSRIRARHTSASPSSSLASSQFGSMPPPKQIPSAIRSTSSAEAHSVGNEARTAVPDEDEFLKELRQAREAMSQDAEWFKTQTAEMEKDVKQGEELRRSQQDRQSRHYASTHSDNPDTSISGLARANGYEYLPNVSKSSQSLSRTEHRIRHTGAHGLATKPIGGSTPEYVPVAMSKRSAMRYSTTSQDNSQLQGHLNMERTHIDSIKKHIPFSKHSVETSSSAPKRLRGDESNSQLELKPRPVQASRIHSHSQKSFAALNDIEADEEDEQPQAEGGQYQRYLYAKGDEADIEDYDSEAEEVEDEDEELNEDDEEDDEDNEGKQRNSNHYRTTLPSAERFYDDDDGEDDGVEDEDGEVDAVDYDDDDDDGDDYGYHPAFTYPTISRGTSESTTASQSQSRSQSQSQSGPGASVDDAVVLSD